VLLFAFSVGYSASLAEPALASLGITVEEVTAGASKKFLVMHAVGFGVGLGLIIGVAKKAMVSAGNLDKAGIGFVFEVPVEKAVGFVEAHEVTAGAQG